MTAPRTTPLGSTRAQFEAAVRPILPRVYRYCISLTGDRDRADDLFQNAVLKAFLNASSYEGRSDLAGWLCGIARNEYLETRRTEARRHGLFDRFVDACTDALGLTPSDAKAPDRLLMQGEESELLLACLQQVPEDFRTVVVLCDIEELSYDEVARMLGIPKGTVKSRHARGRARLREVYERVATGNLAPAREEST